MTGSIAMDFTAGTSIGEAGASAQRVADILQINVSFAFNGVDCWVAPGGSADALEKNFLVQVSRPMRGPRDYRHATSTVKD